MGCSASKEVVVSVQTSRESLTAAVKHSIHDIPNSPTVSLSDRNTSEESLLKKHKDSTTTTTTVEKKTGDYRSGWKIQPGYSSGADSFGGDDSDDERTSEKVPADRSRHSSILALSDLRQEMVAEGDLTKTVVRIETPFGKPIEEIYDGVHSGPVLGSGVSGIVRLVSHRATGVKYAVKCLDIGLICSTEAIRQLREEIFIMCQLDHPNIVRIEEVYESTDDIFIVQELCHGGDLFDRLDEQPEYHYTEAQCAKLVKQMLSALRYLHKKGVIHRDLKLENFLFSSTAASSELKMIDFGLSKHFMVGQHHSEKVGTPYTVAPEIISGNYDEKSDIWSLGVITYLLLSGETPFGGLDGENPMSVKDNILRAKVSFEPADVWSGVSDVGREFVQQLLNPDSTKRPTAKEAQKADWIQVWAKKDTKEGAKLDPRVVGALVGFKECSDMQKLLSEVLSFTLLPEQIVELRAEFEKIDTSGRGEISLYEMKQVLMDNAEAGALGALTEQEIEEIFDSIRIRKSEPRIRWHEFLAAGLSQARVDDRNLRLAFDRLDSDRKGYITFDNIQDLLGGSTGSEPDALETIWKDSLQECKEHLDRISYSDFLLLMKGQPKDKIGPPPTTPGALTRTGGASADIPLSSVLEGIAPRTPLPGGPIPLPPVHEGRDQSTAEALAGLLSEGDSPPRPHSLYRKSRSRSLGDGEDGHRSMSSLDARRDVNFAVVLPGRTEDEIVDTINDTSMSPLAVNRAVYRKHREMRLAVLEASKQFDQTRDKRRTEEYGMAGLIMRRGAMSPVELEDAHQRALYNSASKRGGRARRTRHKTVSDVTGMLLNSQA